MLKRDHTLSLSTQARAPGFRVELRGTTFRLIASGAWTVAEATKAIEGLMPVYDRLGELLELPYAEFEAKYPAFKDETKAAQPLAEVIVPDVHQLLAKERRSQARLAMLLAAVAVAESGSDKLNEFRDPFGEGPFEYRPLEHGFEMKSKLLYEGQPVTLTVGARKTKNQDPRTK